MSAASTRDRAHRHAGVTLVETIISALIVAGLFVAALDTLGAARGAESRTAERTQAHALAEALLSEVLSQPFEHDASPALAAADASDDTTRTGYHSVNDYHGWASAPPMEPDGSPIAGYARWRREVDVQWVLPATLEPTNVDTGAKQVTVRVLRDELLLAELTVVRTAAWPDPTLADEAWRE
ncbi:MAG: hypothetical protein WD009_12465 [Phycisphaeraceae bacterium]